jgi:glucosamine kinase
VTTLAVDLGQTESRVLAITATDRTTWRDKGYDPAEGPLGGLQRVIGGALERLGEGSVDTVCAGATGLLGQVPPSLSGLGSRLHDRYGVRRLVVADDAVTSALGATGGSPGVVAAIGTGLVAMGIGLNGKMARIDGAGPLVGDEGSGFWIGQRGLMSAMRSVDGRDLGSPAIRAAAELQYGPLSDLPELLRNSPAPIALIAAFARGVAQLARTGDAIAVDIWRSAGRRVADSLVAAAHRSEQTEPIPYYLIGGVAHSADLLQPGIDPVLAVTGRRWARAAPLGDALDGAAALANNLDWTRPSGVVGEYVASPDHEKSL